MGGARERAATFADKKGGKDRWAAGDSRASTDGEDVVHRDPPLFMKMTVRNVMTSEYWSSATQSSFFVPK